MEDFDLSQLAREGNPSETAIWLTEMAKKSEEFLPKMERESVEAIDKILSALEQIGVAPSFSVIYAVAALATEDDSFSSRESCICSRSFVMGYTACRLLHKNTLDSEGNNG